MGSSGDKARTPRLPRARLLLWPLLLLLFLTLDAPAIASPPLRTVIEDVPGSSGYRYGTKDDLGNSMHTLKIVKGPSGGYLGVYHSPSAGAFTVKVATSTDLLNWRFAADLAQNSSQPTIYPLRGGAALVAYESHEGCIGSSHCLALRYYPTEASLLSGVPARAVVLPSMLSKCAEGTPNIFAATKDLSSIDIGFHYFDECHVDRQARGTLTDFDPATWMPRATPNVDAAVLAAGASPDAMIGDRDGGIYEDAYYRVIEGQLRPGDFSSWRNFLYTAGGATQLTIRTHRGSLAFANPTFTTITLPDGKPGIVVTQFLPTSAAATGETGELVYYRPVDPAPPPTIAAAGDISCANRLCMDDETSNLLVADPPTKVLTLGDNQYEHGDLVNFQKFYAPDWGRVYGITMPTPGNHDPPSSGYTAYFNKPPNYSFDLGRWHLIALDSTNIPQARAFLDSDLAANSGRRCILAFWHHPRFSSGGTHNNNAAMGPLWTRLYAARADVVLVGHEHTYERFAPQTPAGVASPTGIREFIVGTGGKVLHGFGTIRANSEVRLNNVYGVLRMTLHPTSYDWRLQGTDGGTYDSGSSSCS